MNRYNSSAANHAAADPIQLRNAGITFGWYADRDQTGQTEHCPLPPVLDAEFDFALSGSYKRGLGGSGQCQSG